MFDGNILITIIPPIFAALIAYAIAKINTGAKERIQRAKIEAEADHKAMQMVKAVMEDVRTELKNDIKSLKEENVRLKDLINVSKEEIESLRSRLRESSEHQNEMKIEIASLRNTIQWYEKRLSEAESKNSGSLINNQP